MPEKDRDEQTLVQAWLHPKRDADAYDLYMQYKAHGWRGKAFILQAIAALRAQVEGTAFIAPAPDAQMRALLSKVNRISELIEQVHALRSGVEQLKAAVANVRAVTPADSPAHEALNQAVAQVEDLHSTLANRYKEYTFDDEGDDDE